MKATLLLTSIALIVATSAILTAQTVPATPAIGIQMAKTENSSTSPIAPGAKPVKLAGGFVFTEGATSDNDGNVFFVDQNDNDRIMKWTFDPDASSDNPKGKLATFLHPSGFANGMCFDNDGNLIVCADEKNELWSIAAPLPVPTSQPFKPADLKITVLLKDYKGKLLNAPNDVWVIPAGPAKGGMYLTDPLYPRSWWGAIRPKNDRISQQPGNYVYYFSPDRKTLAPVITDFNQPNGIIGTADGKTLFVSDINAGKTWKYAVHDDGTLAEKTLFCNTGSDGMTIDNEGNIYTTHSRGLMIWDKNGNKIDQLSMQCANVCFAGKNKDILFINSAHEVHALKMRTHGIGPQ